ncbi:MAG: L-glutamate gamma-semialdehyde dehydrogenase [Myxococcota bacterium]|nr:L-glutamate gamma-semialdehyde dehydrogenase [Myxococcota bacterium]MDW8363654.1 L-glutamate gamma-semialdehyde dehydrogenase [Myxococcales bacterium]
MHGARVPSPVNSAVRTYAPGTPERDALVRALAEASREPLEIPVLVGGREVRTDDRFDVVMPHAHRERVATVHRARRDEVSAAIEAAMRAAPAWAAMDVHDRLAIFLRAAELLEGPWRMRVNAACMLAQSKTCHQAEIDAACELVDFLRFNAHFAERLADEQPLSVPGAWNRVELRPLEGFVLAIGPFNFLSIAANLALAPLLMGNVVLWKPAHATLPGCWLIWQLLTEAGLPRGVLSLLPGEGPEQAGAALDSPHLAGIHFTGSTGTFRALWRGVAERLDRYRGFPRLVGETGGKGFLVAHPSADPAALVTAIVRGGYEYQGQKCSALSRLYLPRSLAADVRERLLAELGRVRVGDVRDFGVFLGALVDERAYRKVEGYLALARGSARVLYGGRGDPSNGWFVEPTYVEVDDPAHRLMQEEIFGPVVTAWVYEDGAWLDVLDLVDRTSPYALTGAVFARDRVALVEATARLRQSAGNFYVNDKPTGAVVGQQPFGGARASGTNDKAGAPWNLLRWCSPRSIKETFVPPIDWRYPFMD